MQTKHEIETILAEAGIRPNRRLGQNFLIDLNLMRMIVECADIKTDDVVLEVGCGTGSMTEALAEKAGTVIIAELDRALAEIASQKLADRKNVKIFNVDILADKHHINPHIVEAIEEAKLIFPGKFKLVANLPYNAGSAVMLNLVTGPFIADEMHVTVQKEVGDRMMAKAGGPEYGILGILLAATGETVKVRVLKPSCFWPQPQVESMMLSFIRVHKKADRIKNMEIFTRVVNLFMGHRRKMLKGCIKLARTELGQLDWDIILENLNIDPTIRPEQVPVEAYIDMANQCDL